MAAAIHASIVSTDSLVLASAAGMQCSCARSAALSSCLLSFPSRGGHADKRASRTGEGSSRPWHAGTRPKAEDGPVFRYPAPVFPFCRAGLGPAGAEPPFRARDYCLQHAPRTGAGGWCAGGVHGLADHLLSRLTVACFLPSFPLAQPKKSLEWLFLAAASKPLSEDGPRMRSRFLGERRQPGSGRPGRQRTANCIFASAAPCRSIQATHEGADTSRWPTGLRERLGCLAAPAPNHHSASCSSIILTLHSMFKANVDLAVQLSTGWAMYQTSFLGFPSGSRVRHTIAVYFPVSTSPVKSGTRSTPRVPVDASWLWPSLYEPWLTAVCWGFCSSQMQPRDLLVIMLPSLLTIPRMAPLPMLHSAPVNR